MKIYYIANSRIPTEKAHGIQIMNMCGAFAEIGVEVELIVPRRLNPIKTNPFGYYDLPKSFKITKIPTIDLVKVGRLGYLVHTLIFSVLTSVYLLFKKRGVIYGRHDTTLVILAVLNRNPIFWEVHDFRFNLAARVLAKRSEGLVSITRNLKKAYEEAGVSSEKIVVAPDAVDIKKFDIDISKEDARRKLDLPINKKLAIYTGHLYDWKGARVLAEAAKYLGPDFSVVFVGGTEKDIAEFRKTYESHDNILIIGKKPHEEVPFYLKAADVLVLPNSGKQEISAKYTSPMKLFEYMTSRRPIVASDLPSIREVLSKENAILVDPDNPKDLSKGILQAANSSHSLSDRAYARVANYSWKQRAIDILK